MKRKTSDEELLEYAKRSLERAFAQSDAARLADILYQRAIETGEPISPDIKRKISEWSGAAGKLLETIPRVVAAKKRAESAKRTIEEFNKNRPLNNKKPALRIAADLMRKYPHLRLPRRTSELAKEVKTRLVKLGGKQPEVRTLRRWLAEAIPKK